MIRSFHLLVGGAICHLASLPCTSRPCHSRLWKSLSGSGHTNGLFRLFRGRRFLGKHFLIMRLETKMTDSSSRLSMASWQEAYRMRIPSASISAFRPDSVTNIESIQVCVKQFVIADY